MPRSTIAALVGLIIALAGAQNAQAAEYRGRFQLKEGGECIDVPYGDYSVGRRLSIHRCQNTANQYFLLTDDGHLVANNGQANAAGQLMCVESDGQAPRLAACRRLSTGDRQWWWRTPYGYLQNNVTSERRGNSALAYNECIAPPQRGIGQVAELVVVNCWETRGVQTKAWVPYPYSDEQRAYDQAREAVARRANERADYYLPSYDPEKRSKLEDAIRAYGPYLVIQDTRTGLCLRPHDTQSAVVADTCGKGVQRFHLDGSGMLREVTSDRGYRGVSNLCVTAPSVQGGLVALDHCNNRRSDQKWWIVNGMIQSRSAGNRCWDIKDEARHKGAYVIGWPCDTRTRPAHQAFAIGYERDWQASGL